MEHRFELFADYSQFYLQEDDARYGDLAWTEKAVERMLALGPHVIGIRTARSMTVPVSLRICEARPYYLGIANGEFTRPHFKSVTS